jgi:hypothetical protein
MGHLVLSASFLIPEVLLYSTMAVNLFSLYNYELRFYTTRCISYNRSKFSLLEEGVKADIFEEVPPGTSVQWCSLLVVVPKPKFSKVNQDKLESHMIRECIDMRIANKSMERNRITQSPVVEDFIYTFHKCKVFSKMDLRQGYHQLMLDLESRAIATFSIPWGNMGPRRLVFGAKCSQV